MARVQFVSPVKNYQTKNCIVCGDTATVWSGHVTTLDGIKIISGFCGDECSAFAQDGWRGMWRKRMGLIEDSDE